MELLAALVVVAAAVALRLAWLHLRLTRLGYRARLKGRDAVLYEERDATGERHQVVIPGEMVAKGPHVIYVPGDAAWDDTMPSWLHGRRQEVLDRIARWLGPVTVEPATERGRCAS